MNKAERDELRRLAEVRTPGRWELNPSFGIVSDEAGLVLLHRCHPAADAGHADAVLIVAAVNALPALLDQLDKLEAATSEEALAVGLADVETALDLAVGYGPWGLMKPPGWRWLSAARVLRDRLGLDQ